KTALQGPSANSYSGHDRSTAFYPLPTQSDEEPGCGQAVAFYWRHSGMIAGAMAKVLKMDVGYVFMSDAWQIMELYL
ncbi:hypothetical protein, partial [Acidithiobacillus thiooxidans]